MKMSLNIPKISKDYSKYLQIDLCSDTTSISQQIDDTLARLEEYQTIINFAKQERFNAISLLRSILDNKNNIYTLFNRIDAIEAVVKHAKNNIKAVECEIEKAEEDMGYKDKMTNMFTPLFKKKDEVKELEAQMTEFKSEDYFL